MRHILIVWELGGNRGHLARLHLTARALAKKGAQITFAVRNYADAAPWLVARGWACVQAPQTALHGWNVSTPVGHADWFMCEGFDQPGQVQVLIQAWSALTEQLQVDAMLLDFAPFAAYAAHYLQVPYLVSSVGFCVPPYFDQPACFRPWDGQAVNQSQIAHAQLSFAFKALRTTLGPRAATDMQALYKPDVVRLCTFAEMDHFADRTPGSVYTGVIWDDSERLPSANWAGSKSRKIFCYLNGPVQDIRPFLDVLKKHKYDGIVVAPQLTENLVAEYTGAGLQIFLQPVNVQTLLPLADLTVTHGGVGLVGQSLCAGVPLLLIAQHAEQALLARRVAQQHLGLATFRAAQPDVLDQKLDAVLQSEKIHVEVARFALQQQGFSTRDAAGNSVASWFNKVGQT
jgi:UDP:flavonoid glycosyltransferase YjiC (YdhE family)